MKMRDQVTVEETVYICDVLWLTRYMSHAHGRNFKRPAVQNVIHDGEIMNSKIPQDADIVLK